MHKLNLALDLGKQVKGQIRFARLQGCGIRGFGSGFVALRGGEQ